MFSLANVQHRYDEVVALAIDDWSAAQGEHRLVLGPSGSGKTTLLHLLAGVLRPQSGVVKVADCDLATLSSAALDRFRGQNIGLVLQRLHLMSSLSVEKNLLLAQYCAGLPQDASHIEQLLSDLGIADRARAYPHQLSHGQAQRVAVARAVLNRPKLILADEPTSNLDDENCQQALRLLLDQADRCGATLLIATHDSRLKPHFEHHFTLPVNE